MQVLVKFESDWADEFSVYGWAIKDKEDWLEDVDIFERGYGNQSWNFGTNEGFEECNEPSWLDNYTVTEITANEAHSLRIVFELYNDEYGNFPNLLEC